MPQSQPDLQRIAREAQGQAYAALPDFVGGDVPQPETRGRVLLIRGVAVFAIVVLWTYLVWRATSTLSLSVWWVSLPLFAVEVHNAIGLTLFTVALWSIVQIPHRQAPERNYRVAVLIPTYNEPEEVLLPTIAAAVTLEPEHETWVLDDGNRPEIRQLALELGARYEAREQNTHAKAGNLNHALEFLDAEIIATLDADHVPAPNFLRRTLPYFDDERVAFVQTPQDFYNDDSFEHEGGEQGRPFVEEAVFYRVIAPGKNYYGGAFWCGTSALVRTEALREIGGVATETVTEDIHTSIRLNRRGWTGVYHNEVLAHGLAPSNAKEYMGQRNRWATGAMQVLREENPLTTPGLSWGQRLSFGTTIFAWFDSWRTLAYMLLPPLVLLTGAAPIDAPGYVYGPLFASAYLLQFIALRLLARGYYPPRLSLLFEVLRMPGVLPATLAILRFGPFKKVAFRVTRKGRSEGAKVRTASVPRLLTFLLALSLTAAAWAAATFAGFTPMTYGAPAAVLGAGAFMLVNVALLIAAIRRIRSARFAGEKRAGVRFDVRLRGHLDGVLVAIHDVSLTGARLTIPRRADTSALSNEPMLTIAPPEEWVVLRSEVTRVETLGEQIELGLVFAPDQRKAVAQLALALFAGYSTRERQRWQRETARQLSEQAA